MNHPNAASPTRTVRPTTFSLLPFRRMAIAAMPLLIAVPATHAQNALDSTDIAALSTMPVSSERAAQAASLIGEALTLAERESNQGFSRTRLNVVRGAASLLPVLGGNTRNALTQRWLRLAMAGGVPREMRLMAMADFFDAAARRDPQFGRRIAGALPDNAARAGAFLSLSERLERRDYNTAVDFALRARSAARAESNPLLRARALTFVAHRLAVMSPDLREEAVTEASSNVRLLTANRERDYLMAEVVGAAAKFDIPTARRIANDIGDEGLKGLAQARINLSEISQVSLTSSNTDRIASLAKASARYDVRAVPILIQLPPQSDVLRALSDALPAIYPTAEPAIEVSLLERMWTYSNTAEASVHKDQLQSRLARLMTLHDVWRGRSWGKQLAWRGGRVQVGAFLTDVLQARRSRLGAEGLQDLASRNINRAITETRTLTPSARAEALLLLAGQILS
ncbi:MAG: hypothetical protein JWN98_2717 [Abditibacteriota bacterium]|nr:hypothetical protein [Abditibacteriota bacterium]